MNDWTDAKIELPDDDVLVLAVDKDTERYWLASHSGRFWVDESSGASVPVSHWVHLPIIPG